MKILLRTSNGLQVRFRLCMEKYDNLHTQPGVVHPPDVSVENNTWKLKGQRDATDWFQYCKTYCSLNMSRAPLCPSSGAQELYRLLLPVVLGALVCNSLVWCGAVGYVSGLRTRAK